MLKSCMMGLPLLEGHDYSKENSKFQAQLSLDPAAGCPCFSWLKQNVVGLQESMRAVRSQMLTMNLLVAQALHNHPTPIAPKRMALSFLDPSPLNIDHVHQLDLLLR
ncbi:hypothetical protein SADUNF_Sadunf10G0145000 [Salix dunnii]|uniref:Uncharacterized protein n=1 Tax=Salix dunnii TaxID=1413687 RepID=A0A835JT47_9ROSI|nr:hypothetical protein SADUNF_Sadunf10G0145000 [Salix dunnii]